MSNVAVDVATSLVACPEIPWAELAPGIEMRMLRRGEGSRSYTVMNRFAPGIVLPRHRHVGEVHAYTIEGRWHYLEYDWTAEQGSFIYEPAGSVHTLAVPADADKPAVVIFTIEEALVLLDDEGNEFMTQDARTIDELYRGALVATGRRYPDAVLP